MTSSNLAAARSGDYRKALETLRDTLAAQLDETEKATHAQLASQYRATLAELAALPAVDGKSARERLADRVATAHVVA
jgi:hypothetical protein